MGPSDWKMIGEVSKELGFRSISEFIRKCAFDVIDKYRAGEIKKPELNIEDLQAKSAALKREEIRVRKLLSDKAFDNLKAFAVRLGSDGKLEKNIGEVLEKLKYYDCTGSERFTSSDLVTFIQLLDVVLQRRKAEADYIKALREKKPQETIAVSE